MRSFMRSAVAVLAAVGMLIVFANGARAEEATMRTAAGGETASAFVALVGRPLPGARVESVLTSPRDAVAGTKRGSGWLLHYGTERDNCARADATSGLRMMCVAW